ncbi:tetratricopeptide repeat protein [Shewanella algidipiscicola]|uniref:GGDEF domain-containing protein n=1 Tax=Shewanella algidipiscicola TaxID=614070 RepID=A0ABQ4PL74_9GAMM|nr:histidine kinase [Shewanella algidipiscicola]GIU48797.1 hypothetical protein TUM4630_25930 [Shewanella algidipiscicola]
MDFRLIVFSFSLWLWPSWADTVTELDELSAIVYQYPSDALSSIAIIEQRLNDKNSTSIPRLRLSLLKCHALVQLGENEAAINLARMGDAKAKSLDIQQASPYFLNCMAEAYIDYGDLRQALTLLDTAIYQSREFEQPQSLVNGLMLRGQIDTHIENDSSALEDFRLARDIYPAALRQPTQWITPPQAYLQLARAKLLRKKGQLNQSFNTAKLALTYPQTIGKVRLNILLALAKIAHENQEVKFRDDMILEAKILMPELATANELAESYTELAEVEFLRNNDKNAIQLLNIALNTFNKNKKINDSLRATRLLARIQLANGEEQQGLDLMQQAIAIGQRTNQYDELVICYQLLSEYFVGMGNYRQAYHYQLQRVDSIKSSYEFLKNTRLLQIKAQLGRYQKLAQNQPPKPIKLDASINDNYGLIAILVFALLLPLLMLLSRLRKEHAAPQMPHQDAPLTPQERMLALIASAKQIGYPITILLINPSHLAPSDVATLLDEVRRKLRQQDIMLDKASDQLLIMLPFTSLSGAKEIVKQLKAVIAPLPGGDKVRIGMAEMQHYDTLSSLTKRAGIDQLSRHNEQLGR